MVINQENFKDSPIGLIPVYWETNKLCNLIDVMTDYVAAGSFKSLRENVNVFDKYEYAYYVRLTDLRLGLGHAEQKYVDKRSYDYLKKSNLFGNEILFANIGANVGETWLMPEVKKPSTVAPNMIVIRTDNNKLLDKFFFYYTHSPVGFSKIQELVAGSGHPKINKSELKTLMVPIPPIHEQKVIAHILGLMDFAINKNNQLIAQKELRKKWLMQNLLTGKKRLKRFEGEWKKYSFKELLKVVKRSVIWNEDEQYHLISVRRRSGGIFFRESLYGHQIKVKDLRNAEEGDFLFSKMQIVHGASALVTKEFAGYHISGSYIAVVPFDPMNLNMEFFNFYSQTPLFYHQTYISSYGVHIEKMTFDFDTLLQLEMKLPSYEEQATIAKVLTAAELEIKLLKAKTEKLKEQKKGLMQVLLTGKKRLKDMVVLEEEKI